MSIDYAERIPNNVGLADDRRLRRALESWLPSYLDWWRAVGPPVGDAAQVYLRTAVGVDAGGWAHYDFVAMPDYRWGIFLTPPEAGRTIGFGAHKGDPAWSELPGEYRAELRRLIVTQGDTEPASVEQQTTLGVCCPSLYDLRNLYQVNVEEGRHLWAMVYLLHAYFGRDGREEADELLERHSGDPDKPRILQAFNEPLTDWLSFFLYTFMQDRDGKFQLAALSESGFDPLARSCRFMLTEEAHHMFVGETGVERTIRRSCELMREHDSEDIRRHGGVDLATIQRLINWHFSICLDLFGQERSTNAANYFTMGLKGRFQESKIADDHQLGDATFAVPDLSGGRVETIEIPAAAATNERLRLDFAKDTQRGLNKFNRVIADHGIDFTFTAPHAAFNRSIGVFAGRHALPDGTLVDGETWEAQRGNILPTPQDYAFLRSLMRPVTEPGKMAGWIAPPRRGVRGQPLDFAAFGSTRVLGRGGERNAGPHGRAR